MGVLIRAAAFLTKEIAEIIRQPRLILTLIVGPFAILLLFGIGYQTSYPPVRVLFVDPGGGSAAAIIEEYAKELGDRLEYMGRVEDEGQARQLLMEHEVDLLVLAPANPAEAVEKEEQIPFTFLYNEVDPFAADRMQYVAQIFVSSVNRNILEAVVEEVQANEVAGPAQDVPSHVIVQPYLADPQNLAPSTPDASQFFAAGVIVLLLQHLAVTFAALSIVRERTLGTMDLFRVSPLSPGEALAGKYVSYYLFGAVIGLALVVLMILGLDIPLVGSALLLGVAVAGVLFASLGWGFVISSLARTDSQAVQYAMLVLLTSFFFSGFVLSLETLSEPVRVISRLLPATYGIAFFQDVMLRGEGLRLDYLASLIGLGVVLAVMAWGLLRRELRRA